MASSSVMSPMMNQPTARGRASAPPSWVWELVEHAPITDSATAGQAVVARCERGGRQFALASIRCPNADEVDLVALQRQTTQAYGRLAAALSPLRPRHLVRVWNHIPNILAHMESRDAEQRPAARRLNRYMAFNAGRYAAYQRWYGVDAFADRVPTASGIGDHGGDLVIHMLAAEQGGTPVANPRQIAPYQYSRRYGPIPPCFSRATLLRDQERTMLLAGGTSSVHGEESVYCGDLEAQARETFLNLAALVSAARDEQVENQLKPAAALQLHRYHDLRVYHVRGEDRVVLEQMIGDWFEGAENIEFVQADLCRRDLLVEIEGVARLQ